MAKSQKWIHNELCIQIRPEISGHCKKVKKQIDNYERNGSGWIVSRLVSLDVVFNEMDNPLKPDGSKDTDDEEDKDKDED